MAMLRGYSAIGLHYDQRSFRAVQLRRQRGSDTLTAAARVHRSGTGECPDAGDLRTLRNILDRQGFVGNRVVLAVPTQQMLMSVVEVPPRSSGAPINEIARSELAQIHGCSPAEIESTCWELPPVLGGQTVTQALSLGCTHAVADPLLDAFDQVGLDVVALDGEIPAAIRACRSFLVDDGATGILDLGWQEAGLSLIMGGRIIYHRTIGDAGVGPIAERLSEKLGVDATIVDHLLSAADTDEGPNRSVREVVNGELDSHWRLIASELEAPLSYVTHQYANATVHDLLLTGYTSADDRAADFFANKLNRSVRTVRPRDLAGCSAELDEKASDPSLTSATGLAGFFWESTP